MNSNPHEQETASGNSYSSPFSSLFSARLAVMAGLGTFLSVLCSNGLFIRTWERIEYNVLTNNLAALDPWNLATDATRIGYFQFAIFYSLSPDKAIFTFLLVAMYLFGEFLRIYAVSYIAENLFSSKVAGILTCLLASTNILFLNIGNIPYEANGMVTSTVTAHGLLLFALAAALAGRPYLTAACFAYAFFNVSSSTIAHSSLVLTAVIPWLIGRSGIKSFVRAGALMLLFCFPFFFLIFKSYFLGSEHASLFQHERFMLQLKAAYFRASAFYYYYEKPVQLLYALLCIPYILWGTVIIDDKRLKWTFASIFAISIGQWLAATILVELQVTEVAKAELIRSIWWTNALLPIFYASLAVRISRNSPYLRIAMVFLMFSSVLFPLDVHTANVYTVMFLILPFVIYVFKWAVDKKKCTLMDPLLALSLIATLSISIIIRSSPQKWTMIFLFLFAVVLFVARLLGMRQKQFIKAGTVILLYAILLRFSLFPIKNNPFHWPGRSTDNLYEWVNKTSEGTVFLIPFKWSRWYLYAKRRALMTRYLAIYAAQISIRLPERIQIMKDTGVWDHIDFRFPEGKKQDEMSYLTEAWESLTENRVRLLAKKYNISYVIREQSLPLNFPVAKIIKDQKLVIYDVSSVAPQ